MIIPGKNTPAAPVLPADAVVLGEALVDLIPEEPGAALEAAERFGRHLGGAGANLAVGLARQGVPTALISLLGGDAFGRFLGRRLEEEGVRTDALGQHRSARTGVCFAATSARGERSFLSYRQPSADQLLGPADFQPAHVSRGRLLCLGSATLVQSAARAATDRAVEIARAGKLLLFCDVNYRPHQFSDPREALGPLRRLLGSCDIAKLAQPELLPLFGTESIEAAAQKARALGPAVVVVTLGPQGCYLDCAAGTSYLSGEALRRPAICPIGAGDAFSAGLLRTILAELGARTTGDDRARLRALPFDTLKRACAYGNHLGALCCTELGATTAIPRA